MVKFLNIFPNTPLRKVRRLVSFPVKEQLYKTTLEHGHLRLFIYANPEFMKVRPAILFFHGAGFSTNKVKPNQFQNHANHFASLGYVSICVEYRPLQVEGLFSPIDCILHAKSAIRWVRNKSSSLGIDPNKITVAGASAGGYLSLCCAMLEQFNDISDDLAISCVPNAVVVFNGGVDTIQLITMFPNIAEELSHASLIQHVRSDLPPSILFHGTLDENVRHETVKDFVEKMKQRDNDCTLISFEGMGHGFFNFGQHENIPYERTIKETERFLRANMML